MPSAPPLLTFADQLLNLKDKWVLVTGASQGVGRETAVTLAQLGAHLVLVARSADKLAQVQQLVEATGSQCQVLAWDLAQVETLAELVAQIAPEKLHGVVLNAGQFNNTPAKFVSPQVLRQVFGLNVDSPLVLMAALLRKKRIARQGAVVMVSSLGAHLGIPAQGVYAASKAALTSAARNMAYELAPQGIRVNVVSPGMLDTPFVHRDPNCHLRQEDLERDKAAYPLGYGSNLDVARGIVYLLSDLSQWVTGEELILDGGFRCR